MEFSIIIPKIALQRFVECFWTVEGIGIEKQIVVPDGCSELIFHFGGHYEISDDGGSFVRQNERLVAGQITKAIVLQPSAKSCTLGVKFKPEGLWQLFGVPMNDLSNQVYDFNDVFRAPTTEWHSQLSDVAGLHNKITRLEQLLTATLLRKGPGGNLDVIIQKINVSHGSVRVKTLCEEFKISERKLQRLFLERVGISAKTYSRIARFKKTYALLDQKAHSNAEIAYLHNYFDQPHLNNEFRDFTGHSPEEWFQQHQPMSTLFMSR